MKNEKFKTLSHWVFESASRKVRKNLEGFDKAIEILKRKYNKENEDEI